MKTIDIDDTLCFPRDLVYDTYRDKLVELCRFLPNIESIAEQKREETGSTVELLNLWKASSHEVPAIARKFVKPEMLQWWDYASWRRDEWQCHWRTELGFLREAISCSGVNTFSEVGGQTRLRLSGTITVDGRKIPGIPNLLAGKVSQAVEAFVVKLITPNLTAINRGLENYLREVSGS